VETELRKTGIKIIGDMPWGTHFCHFYETKDDLLKILIPYYKTGLENNEFCIWVISESLTEEEAWSALRQAVPNLDQYVRDQSIEIFQGLDWYLKEDTFDLNRIIGAWNEKLDNALSRGYAGMRVSGDTFWLQQKSVPSFGEYENRLNDSIANRQMILLCTYPLATSGAAEILDVAHTHEFALARRSGKWDVVETPLKQAKEEINRLNEELQQGTDRTSGKPSVLSYAVAVLSFTAALILALILDTYLVPAPGTLFLCALMFSAWYGGVKPGLLTMALSILAIDYYFIPPFYSLIVDTKEIPRLFIFTLSALFVGLLSAAQRRATESLRNARDVLDGTVQELKRANESLQAENAERKRAEEALDERLRFETLVTELSAAFTSLSPNEVDRKIDKWLQTLAEFLGVDRASFLQFEEDWTTLYRSHSYTVPGIEPLPLPPFGLTDQFPWITDQLRQGVTVKWSRVPDDMAEEAVKEKEYAARLGIKSGLNIPVLMGGSVICAITFTSIVAYRDWTDSMVARLRLVGEIFAAAVERKRAEAALQQAEEKYHDIFEHAIEGIFQTTPDGHYITVNPALARMLGYDSPQELISSRTDIERQQYVDPERRAEFKRLLEEHGVVRGFEYQAYRKDGHKIWLSDNVLAVRDESGAVLYYEGSTEDITERKRAEEELKDSNEKLRAFAARLQAVREEESIRIAREIHDELGSALTGLKMDISWLEKRSTEEGNEALQQKFRTMSELIDQTVQKVRDISTELRPAILDDLGLAAAIEGQCRDFQKRTEIKCRMISLPEETELSAEKATAVFRIFQEILTNIARHSQATSVEISMEELDGDLVLKVSDNGEGIKEINISDTKSLGILGMLERAAVFGGQVEITGEEGKGTTVTVRIPRG
jgi:PAS domain S-box-containing protein